MSRVFLLLLAIHICSSAYPAIELVQATYTSTADCSGSSTNSTVLYPTSPVPTLCSPDSGSYYSKDYWVDESTTSYYTLRYSRFETTDTTCSGAALSQSVLVGLCVPTDESSSMRLTVTRSVASAVLLSSNTYSTANDCTGAVTADAYFRPTEAVEGECLAVAGGSFSGRHCDMSGSAGVYKRTWHGGVSDCSTSGFALSYPAGACVDNYDGTSVIMNCGASSSPAPSAPPSAALSAVPSASPTTTPSAAPSAPPSAAPSAVPSASPTTTPLSAPSAAPSAVTFVSPSPPSKPPTTPPSTPPIPPKAPLTLPPPPVSPSPTYPPMSDKPSLPPSPPGTPGAGVVTQHIVQTRMIAEGTVNDYAPAKLVEMEAALAEAAGVSASRVTITVASGSVILAAKILVDSPAQQATVNSNVVAALGTPSAPTNIFASVSGGGVTINAFSVANAVEQLLVAPPASPMNTNGDSGWLWGASTLGSIGPLGTLIVAIVCILYYKRDAIGAYMNYKLKKQGGSHPGTGTRTASTNVQMHKTACPDNV